MYSYKSAVGKLAEKLLQFKKIGVLSHIRPDGDAISAQVAIAMWLERSGVKVAAHNQDPIPENIAWLTGFFPVSNLSWEQLQDCDAYLFVDGNNPKRFGNYYPKIQDSGKPLFMIDHHPNPEPVFETQVSVPEAGSTAELVYFLFAETRPEWLDEKVCTALYTGIMTDTGSFRYDSVGAHTHQILAELIRNGKFTPARIHEKVYDNRTKGQLQLLGQVLQQIKTDSRTDTAALYVTEKNLSDTGCTHDDLDGLVSYPLSLQNTRIAVLFSERDDKVKLSFRSKSDFDVNVLARAFEGGGHQKASAGWHPGPLEKAMEDVFSKIFELAQKNK